METVRAVGLGGPTLNAAPSGAGAAGGRRLLVSGHERTHRKRKLVLTACLTCSKKYELAVSGISQVCQSDTMVVYRWSRGAWHCLEICYQKHGKKIIIQILFTWPLG